MEEPAVPTLSLLVFVPEAGERGEVCAGTGIRDCLVDRGCVVGGTDKVFWARVTLTTGISDMVLDRQRRLSWLRENGG